MYPLGDEHYLRPRTYLFLGMTSVRLCSYKVSLGALLIKAPNCSLATSCIQDLDTGIKFLMECETVSCGAINVRPFVLLSADSADINA